MHKVAVVILNWNGKEMLEKFLPSLVKHSVSGDSGLYVADNGSSDDSLKFIAENFKEIGIVKLPVNYGFAEGYNQALKQIKAEYFILLNSDVEVTSGWVQPLVDLLDSDPTIAACMPKIRAYDDKDSFEYAGAAGGFIDKYGYPFCRGRIFNEIEKDLGQYDDRREVFWATGACLCIRASLYEKAGGLDKDFFAHMEEIDLCWRLKNMGYSIYYEPDSTVYHVGGGTLNMGSPRKTFLNFRNNLIILYKNLPKGKMIKTIVLRLFLDGIAGVKFIFSGEFSFCWAVIKAHFSFYSMIGGMRKKRRTNVNQLFTKYDELCVLPKSIVFSFFLKKEKRFTELHME